MSKPNEEQELSVDFFDEVEEVVDDELELDEEEDSSEEPEIEEEKEETEEELDLETEEDTEESSDNESEEDSEEAEELPLVKSIQQSLGYEFEDEFEDTEEGIQLLVEKAKDMAAEQAVNNYFDRYPDVKELLEYREMGGDPDTFFKTKFPEVNYSEVELEEDNERQHEQIVRQELSQVRGMSNEEIEAEIEDYRNGGILENKAKRSLSALRAKQQSDQESLLEQKRAEQAEQQKQVEQYWNDVKSTIDETTSFKGFKVPSKDKGEFFDYLSKPVEDGKSKAMMAHENADLETRLAIDYLLFKGFKLSDIIDRRAKDQNAKTLRERMKSAKTNKKREQSSSQEYQELGTI